LLKVFQLAIVAIDIVNSLICYWINVLVSRAVRRILGKARNISGNRIVASLLKLKLNSNWGF